MLADLGATVDKVEEPGTGDYTRHMPPMKDDTSALFLGLNRNKRSIAVDLKTPEGVATLKALVKHYDVLVESFRPGVMDRLGCGYEALSNENPRLIFCSISGYGQTGPDRLKAGHDLNYIARSGALGVRRRAEAGLARDARRADGRHRRRQPLRPGGHPRGAARAARQRARAASSTCR